MYVYNDNNDDYIGAELIIKNTVIVCCKGRAACLITETFENLKKKKILLCFRISAFLLFSKIFPESKTALMTLQYKVRQRMGLSPNWHLL